MEFIIASLSWGGSPVKGRLYEVMIRTKLPSVEELLETKNCSGLTARELAKAGRIGNAAIVAKDIVKKLKGFGELELHCLRLDLIDELRGLEKDLAAELKRLSEEKKKPASSEQVISESIVDTNIQITLIDKREGGFPEIKNSAAYANLLAAWSECQAEIDKYYDLK